MSHPSTIYTPESPIRHPLRLLAAMWRDLVACRGLAWRLFVRDTSAAYRQSFLGYLWAFLPPIATTASFSLLAGQRVMNTEGINVPYPVFAGIGTIFWQTFADSVNGPLKSVTAAKGMLTKINFPREALLLAGLGEIFFNFVLRSTLLVALFVLYPNDLSVHPSLLLVPVGAASMVLLGYSIGLLVVPFGMLARDIGRGLTMFLGFWMLVTPVVYPPRTSGWGAVLASWNPVGPVLSTCREWVLGDPVTFLPQYFAVLGVSALLLFLAWVMFRLAMPIIIERMGG
jgi:lipopolysaccharide transport system permease protein